MLKTLQRLSCFFICPCFLYLSSCKPNSAATEQAQLEFESIIDEGLPRCESDDLAEFQKLISHFAETDDVHYRNAQGWTILHLACFFKKPELVRCLLLDGADPLALSYTDDLSSAYMGDSPLSLALYLDDAITAPSEDILAIIRLLLAHGARLDAPAPGVLRSLDMAGLCSSEELFLAIAKQVPKTDLIEDYKLKDGHSINALYWSCVRHWPQSLQWLLEQGCRINHDSDLSDDVLLSAIFANSPTRPEEMLRCVEILLEHGLDINARDEQDCTPLFRLCEILLEQRDFYFDEESLAKNIAFLISHGADPYLRSSQHPATPDFCAYDFIKMRPSLLSLLDEQGHQLKEPPFVLPEDDLALLACLCREYRRLDAATLFGPHVERLQSVLQMTGVLTEHDFYPTAQKAVLELLLQIDAEKANAFVSSLPLWTSGLDDHKNQALSLILELVDLPGYTLAPSLLTGLIEKLVGSEQEPLIQPLMCMLSRNSGEEARAALTTYTQDERKSVRLAALCAKLKQNHLPAPGNHGIEQWINIYHLDKEQVINSAPEIKTALALNSYQELWFDLKSTEEVQFILESLRTLGFPQAADYSQRVHQAFNNPEALDLLSMEDTGEWMLDLDLAIADYIWQHRAVFLPLIDETKPVPQPEAHEHVHGESCMH